MNHRIAGFIIVVLLASAFLLLWGCGSNGGSSSSVTIIPRNEFGPPVAVAAVAGDGSVTVSWNSVYSATSYNLYMATQSGVRKSSYDVLASGVTSPYTRAGLSNNTTYYFVITSVNAKGESSESCEVTATPTAATLPTITISGKIQYEDKEYGPNGFTGQTVYKPVRNADMEIVDLGGNPISGATGTDGTYSFVVSSNTNSMLYVRVMSSVTFTVGSALEVKDRSSNLYSVATENFVPSGDARVNISIPAANLAGGAFNILDVYTNGFEFVHGLTGTTYPPSLSAFWQTGNQYGTYYCSSPDPLCPQGNGIYVLGGIYDGSGYAGDTDEYDDDVLLHEFGHFVADKFSLDQSPGGDHYLNVNNEDLRLSWSEGWGSFFQGAVKAWLSATNPSLLSTSGTTPSEYVDTKDDFAQIYFDFGDPGSLAY